MTAQPTRVIATVRCTSCGEVFTTRSTRSEIVVDVSDTGPGLSRHVLESAFTRGWSTKVPAPAAGRGLGLALVSQVVRKHDGTIAVSTAELGGARFTVRLPVRQVLTS